MEIRRSSLLLNIFLLAACAAIPIATAADSGRIIFANVRLGGHDAPAQDIAVNALVVDGPLGVVTDVEPTSRTGKTYTSSPIAMPIRYYESRKWNKFVTKPVSGLFVGAVVLDGQDR